MQSIEGLLHFFSAIGCPRLLDSPFLKSERRRFILHKAIRKPLENLIPITACWMLGKPAQKDLQSIFKSEFQNDKRKATKKMAIL